MKKGFTLVELLGSIVILAIIALVAFPAVLNLLGSSQTKIDDSMKNYVEEASRSYVNDHVNNFPKDSSVKKVNITVLRDEGYISENNYNNNKVIQNGCVEVTTQNNIYKFTFKSTGC